MLQQKSFFSVMHSCCCLTGLGLIHLVLLLTFWSCFHHWLFALYILCHSHCNCSWVVFWLKYPKAIQILGLQVCDVRVCRRGHLTTEPGTKLGLKRFWYRECNEMLKRISVSAVVSVQETPELNHRKPQTTITRQPTDGQARDEWKDGRCNWEQFSNK